MKLSSPDHPTPTNMVGVNCPLSIIATSSTVASVAINNVGWIRYTKGITVTVGDRCYGCGAFVTSRECLALWDCLSVLQKGFHAPSSVVYTWLSTTRSTEVMNRRFLNLCTVSLI
jgi:hypothetical protein